MLLIAERKALKLIKLANNVRGLVRRDSSLVSVVKSVVNFSFASEKEHDVFFLAFAMVDIVEDMISSDFLTF